MKALEYPKGRSADGIRDLLKSRVNSKGQVVLREEDLNALMAMVDYHAERSLELMRVQMKGVS